MKLNKILYYVFTVLMSGIFLFSAFMYFTEYSTVEGYFDHLGFPTWIIYPLAVLKVLGVLVVWVKKPKLLMEWAYAGFFFDAVIATCAHGFKDGQWFGPSTMAIVFVVGSRFFYELTKKVDA